MAKQTVDKEILSVSQTFIKAATALKEATEAASSLEDRVKASEEAFNKKQAELEEVETNLNAKISNLEVIYKEKERALKFDVELKVKEQGVNAAKTYLANTHKVLETSEFLALSAQAQKTEKDTDQQVAIAKNAVKAEYEAKLAKQNSDALVEAAQDKAKIASQTNEIAFLNKQIASLEEMIKAERAASVERAKAASVPAINLSSGK